MTLEAEFGVGPTFLVIGAARSGTTAITRFLGTHPDVFVTQPKEPHFFAFANAPVRFAGPGDDEKINRHIVSDPARYAALYRHSEELPHRGDGSVSTLYFHDRSIPTIERFAPGVKLVVLLRDPVERAYSSYLYLRSFGFERLRSFDEALAAEPERTAAGWHHMWRYRALSNYLDQLRPFVEAFGRERLHVVRSDRLWMEPDATMAELLRFLEVEPFEFDTSAQVNRSGIPRHRARHRIVRVARRSRMVRAVAKVATSQRFREQLSVRQVQRPPLDPVLAAELREEFAGQLAELSCVLDVDLTDWSLVRS